MRSVPVLVACLGLAVHSDFEVSVMTPVLTVLWLICFFTLCILGVVVYTVIRDCNKRAARRARQREIYDGRADTGSTASN